jgi:hypothetical protein
MRRVRHNFGMGGPVGVLRQLDQLREIVAITDPTVGKHLEAVNADNFLFAFRILLVMFRRELSFSQILLLWEMIWAADFKAAGVWSDGGSDPPLTMLKGEGMESGSSTRGLGGGAKAKEEMGGASEGMEDELCMFCVAAILHHNGARLKREVHEMDDAVKLFNAMELKVDVRTCVESAIKHKRKYLRKRKVKMAL